MLVARALYPLLFMLLLICPRLEASPDAVTSAALRRADRAISKNDQHRAVAELDVAIKRDPQSAETLYKRACCHFLLEDMNAAGADLDAALKINPRYSAAMFERAKVFGELGQIDKAMQMAQAAINMAGKSAPYTWYQDTAAWYMQKGQNTKALEQYNKAMAINPEDAWLRYFRANALFKLGHYNEALADLDKIDKPKEKCNPSLVYHLRARCYDKLGRADLAASARKTAESFVSKDINYFDLLK